MRKNTVIRNSVFSSLAYSLSSILWLILIPIIISQLGEATYGVWALASIIISASNLINLGLPAALTKFTADYVAKNQDYRILPMLRNTDIFFSIIFFLLFLVMVTFNPVIIHNVFGVKEEAQAASLRYLLPLTTLLSLLFLLAISRKSIVDGYQDIRYSSVVTLIGRCANFILTILLIYQNWGVWSLFFASLVENVLMMLMYEVFIRRKLIPFRQLEQEEEVGPKGGFLKNIQYGANLQFSSLISFALEFFYKTIISSTLGLEALGLFQVAWRVTQVMQGFLTSALRPLFPASAFLVGAEDKDGLLRLFNKSNRYAALFGFSVLVLIIPFSDLIFQLWIGKSSDFQTVTFQFLSVWVLLSTLTTPGYLYLMGSGNSWAITKIQGISSGVALVVLWLAMLLPWEFPYWLIGISYALSGLVSFALTVWYVRGEFHWKVLQIVRSLVPTRISLKVIFLMALALLFTNLVSNQTQLIVVFASTALIFALVIFTDIPREDKTYFKNLFLLRFRNVFPNR